MSAVLTARARKLYRDASARHEAGDRVAALKLFRKVAFGPSAPEVVPEIDGAWAMLMADAAEYDGPNAVRTLWRVARAHRKLFPWPGVAVQLVELLMGRDVPDILAEAVAACRAYARNWSLDSDERLVLKLAEEEIDATMDRTSGAAPVPAPHLDVRDRPLPAA